MRTRTRVQWILREWRPRCVPRCRCRYQAGGRRAPGPDVVRLQIAWRTRTPIPRRRASPAGPAPAARRSLHDLDRDSGTAHADDRTWCLETNRVRSELGDLARDVHCHAANEIEDEAEPSLGRCEEEAVEANFAAGSERHARVVFQRDAKPSIAARAEAVRFENLLADCGRYAVAAPDHKHLTRCKLDPTRRRRLLRERRPCQYCQGKHTDPASSIHHDDLQLPGVHETAADVAKGSTPRHVGRISGASVGPWTAVSSARAEPALRDHDLSRVL